MNDLISREDAIAAVGEVHPLDFNGQAILNNINKIPPAQQWIPCGERLPEKHEEVLAFMAWRGCGVLTYEGDHFYGFNSLTKLPDEAVIAWMPLPEPYKEVVK